MKCRRCNADITEHDVACVGIADDVAWGNPALDIVVECPDCGNPLNGFMPINELLDLGQPT